MVKEGAAEAEGYVHPPTAVNSQREGTLQQREAGDAKGEVPTPHPRPVLDTRHPRKPGRPANYVFDKPDEQLTDEERKLKTAILKRRLRQNRSYHRRRQARVLHERMGQLPVEEVAACERLIAPAPCKGAGRAYCEREDGAVAAAVDPGSGPGAVSAHCGRQDRAMATIIQPRPTCDAQPASQSARESVEEMRRRRNRISAAKCNQRSRERVGRMKRELELVRERASVLDGRRKELMLENRAMKEAVWSTPDAKRKYRSVELARDPEDVVDAPATEKKLKIGGDGNDAGEQGPNSKRPGLRPCERVGQQPCGESRLESLLHQNNMDCTRKASLGLRPRLDSASYPPECVPQTGKERTSKEIVAEIVTECEPTAGSTVTDKAPGAVLGNCMANLRVSITKRPDPVVNRCSVQLLINEEPLDITSEGNRRSSTKPRVPILRPPPNADPSFPGKGNQLTSDVVVKNESELAENHRKTSPAVAECQSQPHCYDNATRIAVGSTQCATKRSNDKAHAEGALPENGISDETTPVDAPGPPSDAAAARPTKRGRPASYIFDKMEHQLTSEEQKIKAAIIKRRERQNRYYHRRKKLLQDKRAVEFTMCSDRFSRTNRKPQEEPRRVDQICRGSCREPT